VIFVIVAFSKRTLCKAEMPFSLQSCDVCALTGSSASACSLGHNHRLARIAID
jgi:hypothetical protein